MCAKTPALDYHTNTSDALRDQGVDQVENTHESHRDTTACVLIVPHLVVVHIAHPVGIVTSSAIEPLKGFANKLLRKTI